MVAQVKVNRTPAYYSRWALNGVPINTAFPPDLTRGYVRLEDETSGDTWEHTLVGGVPTWVNLGSSSNAIALNDIVIGTGTGITGSANAQYDIAAGDLTIRNAAGLKVLGTTGVQSQVDMFDDQSPQIPVLEVQGQQSLGKRGVFAIDEAAAAIVSIPAMSNNRALIVADQGGNPIEKIDATTAGRTIKEIDSNNVTMRTVATIAATRTDTEFDAAGVNFRKASLATALRVDQWLDQAGVQGSAISLRAGVRLAQWNDDGGVAVSSQTLIQGANTRTITVADQVAGPIDKIDTMFPARTWVQSDEAGTQTMAADLASTARVYRFGPPGAVSQFKIDTRVHLLQSLAADGTTVVWTRDWLSGVEAIQSTDSSGTPGNAVINKPSGRSALAIGAAAVTITNSLFSGNTRKTKVFISVLVRDATALLPAVTARADGSFTLTTSANATAALIFDWWIIDTV